MHFLPLCMAFTTKGQLKSMLSFEFLSIGHILPSTQCVLWFLSVTEKYFQDPPYVNFLNCIIVCNPKKQECASNDDFKHKHKLWNFCSRNEKAIWSI